MVFAKKTEVFFGKTGKRDRTRRKKRSWGRSSSGFRNLGAKLVEELFPERNGLVAAAFFGPAPMVQMRPKSLQNASNRSSVSGPNFSRERRTAPSGFSCMSPDFEKNLSARQTSFSSGVSGR